MAGLADNVRYGWQRHTKRDLTHSALRTGEGFLGQATGLVGNVIGSVVGGFTGGRGNGNAYYPPSQNRGASHGGFMNDVGRAFGYLGTGAKVGLQTELYKQTGRLGYGSPVAALALGSGIDRGFRGSGRPAQQTGRGVYVPPPRGEARSSEREAPKRMELTNQEVTLVVERRIAGRGENIKTLEGQIEGLKKGGIVSSEVGDVRRLTDLIAMDKQKIAAYEGWIANPSTHQIRGLYKGEAMLLAQAWDVQSKETLGVLNKGGTAAEMNKLATEVQKMNQRASEFRSISEKAPESRYGVPARIHTSSAAPSPSEGTVQVAASEAAAPSKASWGSRFVGAAKSGLSGAYDKVSGVFSSPDDTTSPSAMPLANRNTYSGVLTPELDALQV